MIKQVLISAVALFTLVIALTGCNVNIDTSQNKQPSETPISMENMERVDVYLPDLDEEWKDDFRAFYEKYEDKVIVITGQSGYNHLTSASTKYAEATQGGGGRFGCVRLLFDEADKTEQVMNLEYGDNIVVEGILVQPRTKNSPKPSHIELEHCKLLDWATWENRMLLKADITSAFEETKAELLKKYSFVKNIDFELQYSDGLKSNGKYATNDIGFDTEVVTGTLSKDVLAYANDAARLLNNNYHKIDDSITLSDDTYYGDLYKNVYMLIKIYPEGMKGQTERYYIYHVLSSRRGKIIKLEKTYQ